MKNIVIGILAHVDAGKTTLSEGLLYSSGAIRKLGRVDKKDAYLDTFELERRKGITIFAKQAVFNYKESTFTLLDTPGHVDFSAEMERTLAVLDYAILVVSGADGVQAHTRTLVKLLNVYEVPTLVFVNKMDQPGTDKAAIMSQLHKEFGDKYIDISNMDNAYEAIATCDENALDEYLENESINDDMVSKLILERKLMPVLFGSALKLNGVEELLETLNRFCIGVNDENGELGARVFKIARDENNAKLAYIKVTSGELQVKMPIGEDKINQIRLYSGTKYDTLQSAVAGQVVAVTGLEGAKAGQGIGIEEDYLDSVLTPVLSYELIPQEGTELTKFVAQLRQLEDEEPQLHISWDAEKKAIAVYLMGAVQTEVLAELIKDRYGVDVAFGPGKIVYRETIARATLGVGHYEPLRHYAEAHLLMEPGERGSGITINADCSEDLLDRNWQRLIMTHLEEKQHKGVLTGAPITDIAITVVAGRAHNKHTEGGDFREATYRAVRQGLMSTESILLEPVYSYRLAVPQEQIGRAMSDIERMHGTSSIESSDGELSVIAGKAPVACMQNYSAEVNAYTHGKGQLSLVVAGYEPCHNAEEIIENTGYDPLADLENPTGSIFCSHGAGYLVDWNLVWDYMHVESEFLNKRPVEPEMTELQVRKAALVSDTIAQEEIEAIFNQTFYANRRSNGKPRKKYAHRHTDIMAPVRVNRGVNVPNRERYLLVDGYNVIYAWDELAELAKDNLDGARGALLDKMSNYQGFIGGELIVVFDAYRVKGHDTEIMDYHNIHVVYTKEAETADRYIEKFSHTHGKEYDITVATSDGLEQVIIRGAGCKLVSSRDLYQLYNSVTKLQ